MRLADVQARMLLKADAYKFRMGYLWWFIEPLLWVSIFYLVFDIILDTHGQDGSSFLVFLATGKLAFIWFSKTVQRASLSIVGNAGLIAKVNVPKALVPMAVVQEGLYRQSTVYGLMLAILLLFGYAPTLAWLWLVPLLLVYYLMIVACALVGAYLVCLVRDFIQIIPLGMTFLLFVSGVFWDIHQIGDPVKVQLVLTLDPLAYMVDAHRQILIHHQAPDLGLLLGVAAGSCLLTAGMVWLMRRHSQMLALRVLT
ncbi:MAG: ABC transporter permease [Parahaliea sp.]